MAHSASADVTLLADQVPTVASRHHHHHHNQGVAATAKAIESLELHHPALPTKPGFTHCTTSPVTASTNVDAAPSGDNCANSPSDLTLVNTAATTAAIDSSDGPKDIVKLGEYLILGYNGSLPQGDRGRRRSKYVLFRRAQANGVVRGKSYRVKCHRNHPSVVNMEQHTVSFATAKNQTVIYEYDASSKYDMFQIGRSSEAPIDFIVTDTVAGNQMQDSNKAACQQSTISRFACRVLIQRNNTSECQPVSRIYAAGFDSSRNIHLSEKATKWEAAPGVTTPPQRPPKSPSQQSSGGGPPQLPPQGVGSPVYDGLTTNGVLILKPDGPFCAPPDYTGPSARPGTWREVSVNGDMFVLRESRSGAVRGERSPPSETNALTDGTLIDLCGATLLWRSAAGLAYSPTQRQLERYLDAVNSHRPQCPVSLQTLVVPTRKTSDLVKPESRPVVYIGCGHVQGQHNWGKMADASDGRRTCPICMKPSLTTELMLGSEPAFYVDCDVPDHCFAPCGHMASRKTVAYWSSVPIPCGTAGFHSACPFCATPLTSGAPYVRLIFQEEEG